MRLDAEDMIDAAEMKGMAKNMLSNAIMLSVIYGLIILLLGFITWQIQKKS